MADIQVHFGGVFHQNRLGQELELLQKEMSLGNWRKKAEESIVQLFTISTYQEVARAIKDAAIALGLTSTFQVVEHILSSVGNEAVFRCLPLKEVSKAIGTVL